MRILITLCACLCFGSAFTQGKLFIIGGGHRPQDLMARLIQESAIAPGDYIAVLPMASAEPDSAVYYIRRDFARHTSAAVVGFNDRSATAIDSIRRARIIFITGGDQNRFMSAIEGSTIAQAVRDAFNGGALVAGTSAGAAVMSERMITGNQKKYSYSETFGRIEQNNLELAPGLGLITGCVIDQHFVARSRFNRLINVVIENPVFSGIGIDESTAILVTAKNAEVVGRSQVIVISNPHRSITVKNGKLGAKELKMSIYLPGEKFSLIR